MNLSFYLEKLHSSEQFKDFMKQNPKAFLCSCFFVIDLENSGKPDDKQHFDYFIPEKKQIFSFQMEEGTKLVPLEKIEEKLPEKISDKIDFDFNELRELIEKRAIKEGVKNKIQKIMFSLQKSNGKEILIGTVFISMLGMISLQIELPDLKIIKFEKRSFFDMVKVFKKK